MKKLMIFAVAVAGFGLASCSKSDLQTPKPTGRPNELPVQVSLNAEALTRPGGAFTPAVSKAADSEALAVNFGETETKATPELTTEQDSKVLNVWAIQYKADGTLLGSPFYTADIPAAGSGSAGIDATYDLSVNLTSNAETGGKVYFIANTHSPTFFNETNAATEAKLKEVVKAVGTELKPTATSGIPMLGVYTGKVESSAAIAHVPMKRLMAKVILKYKVNPSFAGFEVTSIQIKNAAANIYFGPEPSGIFPAKSDNSHVDYAAEVLTAATDEGDYKKFVWYVPENLRSTISGIASVSDRVLSKTDGKATYIEIRGTLKSSSKCEKAVYSILLGDPTTNLGDFNVKRNNAYTVTVDIQGTNTADKRIEVESFDMNNSAMIKPNSGEAGAVTFDIRKVNGNSWTMLPTLGANAALRAEILWQDGNVINAGDVTLDKVNGLLTVKSTKTTVGNAVVALYNNATTGGDILWSWHIWVTDYQPDGSQSYNLGINSKASVPGGEVHTYGEEYKKASDKMGGPLRVIMDRDLGATKAYYAAPQANDATVTQTFGLMYQWGRKDPLPKWRGTGSTDNSAALTWPMYGADGTTEVMTELGYSSTDGTVTSVAVADAMGSEPNAKNYSIKNPTTFIASKITTLYDWYTDNADNQDNTLWGGDAPKSAYDPCPQGWRVAPNGTWDDFGSDSYADPFLYYINGEKQTAAGTTPTFVRYAQNGRLYEAGNVKSWYPAIGYRYRTDGQLYYIGHSGYRWTSSVIEDSNNASRLTFSYNSINPQTDGSRSLGFQVRCIQE